MIIDKNKFDLFRAECCMKIQDVLLKAECSKFVIQKVNDQKDLDPYTVGKIAKALGVSVVDIIVKEGG